MSGAANELAVNSQTFAEWHVSTRNEHEDDLRSVWTWMLKQADALTVEDLEGRLRRPFVTVTRKKTALSGD
jgi:hypothetical protein